MVSIRLDVEDLKNIPICDLFYRVAVDTRGLLPKTNKGNKYILVAIDHYSKWCETKVVSNQTTTTVVKFLEKYIICRYEVPKFIFSNDGGEWSVEFDNNARFTSFTINIQCHNGLDVTRWLKG
jgi:hypothetical protein